MTRTLTIAVCLLLAASLHAEPGTPPNPLDTDRAGWSTYTHTLGTSFEHPADWAVRETGQGLLLVPAGARVEGEMYVLAWMPTQVGVGDPAFVQQVDAQMIPPGSAMKRTEASVVEHPLGVAKRLRYEGPAPTGEAGTAVMYVVELPINDQRGALVFLAAGKPDAIEARLPQTDRIFASLTYAKPEPTEGDPSKIDPKLVGSYRTGTTFHDPGVGGSVDVFLHLRPDGSVVRNTQSTFYMQQRTGNGTVTGGVDANAEDANQGTWTADGTTVTVRWNNGETLTAKYKVFSNGVEVFLANGEKLVLEKV
ncbi:MAG: hypothetical protein AAF656_02735 [Planctomycetota bacterium]